MGNKISKIHCFQCGTQIIPKGKEIVRYCRNCAFDFQRVVKAPPRESRETWIKFCICGKEGFQNAPICTACGTNLSSMTLKPIEQKSAKSSTRDKLTLTAYAGIIGIQLDPELLSESVSFLGGIFDTISDIFT